jgi:sec-independent protein translocase protein TatB
MFDLSWSELLVCGAIALVVIGPKELPKTLKQVSRGVGHVRKMYKQVISGYHSLEREVNFATGDGKPRQLLDDMMIPDIPDIDEDVFNTEFPASVSDNIEPTKKTASLSLQSNERNTTES